MNSITQLVQALQASNATISASDTTETPAGLAGLFAALLEQAQGILTESGDPSTEDFQGMLEAAAELASTLELEEQVVAAPVDDEIVEVVAAPVDDEIVEFGIATQPVVVNSDSELLAPPTVALKTQLTLPSLEALQAVVQKIAQGEKPAAKSILDGTLIPSTEEGAIEASNPEPLTLRSLFARAVAEQEANQSAAPATPLAAPIEQAEPAAATLRPVQTLPQIAVAPQSGLTQQGLESGIAQGETAPERALPPVVDVREVGNFTVRTVRYLAAKGQETVTVRLVPRSLGELHITLRSGADGLEVVLTAANQAARETLELRIPELREALARDGIEVTKVTVQTFTRGDSSTSRFGAETSNQNGHGDRRDLQSRGERQESEADPRGSPRTGFDHDGTLNTFV